MTVRIILKSGKEFSVTCDEFALSRSGHQGVTGYIIRGAKENVPLYLDISQVAAIIHTLSPKMRGGYRRFPLLERVQKAVPSGAA